MRHHRKIKALGAQVDIIGLKAINPDHQAL